MAAVVPGHHSLPVSGLCQDVKIEFDLIQILNLLEGR
jgi:hypothetical protein